VISFGELGRERKGKERVDVEKGFWKWKTKSSSRAQQRGNLNCERRTTEESERKR